MTPARPFLSARAAFWIAALLWSAAAAFLVVMRYDMVGNLAFRDADDALRLVQVRDWMAGQSWFDVTQYRIHPPDGVPMHWSRIVDLPIAAMLASLNPVLGPWLAERTVLVALPLMLLGVLFALIYALTYRMTGRRGETLVALALAALSIPVIAQFALLRIDHHGWQIILGTLMMLGLVDVRRPERGAMLAGLAAATWMQISIEGLPFSMMAGALLGARFWQRGSCWPAFRAFMLGLGFGLAGWQFALRGFAGMAETQCDVVGLPYLAPILAALACTVLTARFVDIDRSNHRLLVLLIGGSAALIAFALLGRHCLAGPFAHLDPLVRSLWYVGVAEGLPIEMQTPQRAATIIPCLVGIVGTLLATRHATKGQDRVRWLVLLVMLCGATLIGSRVLRALGLASVLALPGSAWMLAAAFKRLRRLDGAAARICLTPFLLFITPAGSIALAAAILPPATRPQTDISRCVTLAGTRGLGRLPAATFFTPLDIGSHIIAYTPHSVVATGHHRNLAAMKLVIRAFVAPPDEARRLIATTPARYVAFCVYGNEAADFYRYAPQGLAALLARGAPPDWLERVPMPRSETLLVYRIRPDGSSAPRR